MKLERTSPSKAGISPTAISKFLSALDEHGATYHSLMILRHDKVVAEGYKKPYRAEYNHIMHSLSKSFTSTAVGFAVYDGLLDVEDYVISFFPEMLKSEPCENMKKMKVKHLLTMSTGHTTEPPGRQVGPEWLKYFLQSYVEKEPGSLFLYNTPASYVLSAIVQKVTGRKIFDYLNEKLFKPLSIENIRWEESDDGINTGGWGLNLKTEDIAKFGVFIKNRGMVDGKQLLNSEWIDVATSKVVENYGEKDWGNGYGYQFWQCEPEGSFRADGAFGQYCYVDRKNDLIIASTGGLGNMQILLNDIYDNILPGLTDETATLLPDSTADDVALEEKLKGLCIPPVIGKREPPNLLLKKKSYKLSKNCLNITEISFSFENTEKPHITVVSDERSCDIALGFGEYVDSDTYVDVKEVHSWFHDNIYEKVSASYGFEGDILKIKLVYPTTPSCDNIEVRFDKNTLIMNMKRENVFFPTEFEAFGIEL